ncbi:folate-binding protein [Pseudoxanthomonas composti]|uniref:Folate-binding protein n=1 Tax=Pseudoxanthomonas composti TaxID=2137479 RepID=A0A4Q1JWN6_9GAMM|nr:folate-binding protein [Pseudoxanthomonas composti]
MPHRSASNASPFALPDHAVIELIGPDAEAFCHAQFASDVKSLAPGQWQWSAWLTPKGRVIALFALCRISADRLVLVLPDAPVGEVVTGLQRFVFRKKVQVRLSSLQVSGVFAQAAAAAGDRLAGDDETGFELDRSDAGQPRHWRLQTLPAAADDNAASCWRACDLRCGLPRLDPAQREQWTPQQLSLERFAAYSVKKGCYPGQEIVARTHFLGKAKRQLVLMEATAGVSPGQRVGDGEREVGDVVSVASEGPTRLLLAVMPLERNASTWKIADANAQELALRDPLAR